MSKFKWDSVKNKRLKKIRGVSFEEILSERYLTTRDHPNRDDQQIMLYERQGYVWLIPFVVHGGEVFLKTLYPSRYWTKVYKKGDL